eukprot:scaffold11230_cov109-Cylindrotheca_fusiformis.AAC.3
MQHHEEAEDEAWIYNGHEEVPATVRRVKIAENITGIPHEAFIIHDELEEVTLSSSVQVIRNMGPFFIARDEVEVSILHIPTSLEKSPFRQLSKAATVAHCRSSVFTMQHPEE